MCWSRSNRDCQVPVSPVLPVGTMRPESYGRLSNPVYHDGEAIAAFAEGRFRSPSSMADLQSPVTSSKARKQHVPYETPEKLPRRPLSQVRFDDHTAGQRSDKQELGRRVYNQNPAYISTLVLGPHDEWTEKEVEKQPVRSNSCGGYPAASSPAGGYTRHRQDDRYLCEKASRKVFHQGLGTRARQVSDYDHITDVYDKCPDWEHNKPAGISTRLRSERKKGSAVERHAFRCEAAGVPRADAEEKSRSKKQMPQRPHVEDVSQVVYNKSLNMHDVHHFEQVMHALHSGAAGAGVESFDFEKTH